MRKIILGLVAATTVVAPLAIAGVANAAVSVNDGIGHVDKGDVQSALKLNNAGFDRGTFTFTGTATKTFDNVLTCKADAGAKAGLVEHVKVTSTSSTPLTATAIKSANGKQITGWDLTGRTGAVAGSNDLMQVLQRSFTLCLPDKPFSEMTPSEMSRQALWTIDNVGTVTLDGLAVNGVDLPNTPVEAPAA